MTVLDDLLDVIPQADQTDFSACGEASRMIHRWEMEPIGEKKPHGKEPCAHERLNEDGICRSCGADKRGIG
jgi:hypothetical protein